MNNIWNALINLILSVVRFIRFLKNLFLDTCLLIIFFTGIFFITRNYCFSPTFFSLNPSSILKMHICGALSESYYDNTTNYGFNISINTAPKNVNKNSIFFIKKLLKNAALDNQIKGLYLELEDLEGSSLASLEYLGKCLAEFKDTGKKIYIFGKNFTQEQYYLASFANQIFLQKDGIIIFSGFSHKKLYFGNLLKKLKINVHVFKDGKYKSSIDPMLEEQTPEDTKDQDVYVLDDLLDKYISVIAKNRNISKVEAYKIFKEINEKINTLGEDITQYIHDKNLVDFVASEEEAQKIIRDQFSKLTANKNYQYIDMYSYNNDIENIENKEDNVAVLAINGILTTNKNEKNAINIDETIKQIEFAKNDEKIKALVFFINSPGGDILVAEKIRLALVSFTKCKKPLIILMGGTATSGGYWIATAGDYIFAHATTITGSIGIFSILYTFEDLLKNLGIKYDGAETPTSEQKNPLEKLPEECKKKIQEMIEKNYQKFIEIVLKSRTKISKEKIQELAQGQVFTGTQAQQNGLVDKIGDINDAIKEASKRASIQNPQIMFLDNSRTETINLSYIINNVSDYIIKKIMKFLMQNYFPQNISIQSKNIQDYNKYIVH
ncbi:signal peptide peptidase SppA [Buchnera aphidicola]|uniref:signal peptide peptidase SppA n=1 Tax=Buchnera aphidicola TaxID=9 RepID=UPI0034641D89